MENFIRQIKDVSGFIFSKGLSEGASGNISAVADKIIRKKSADYREVKLPIKLKNIRGMSFCMTSTGSRMYKIMDEPEKYLSLINVSNDGCSYFILEGGKPTSEILCHLLSYENNIARSGFSSIVHVHAKHILSLAVNNSKDKMNRILSDAHTEFDIFFPNGIGYVKRLIPGSLELAEATAIEFENYQLIVWKNHGMTAAGESLYECFDKLETVESIAEIITLSK